MSGIFYDMSEQEKQGDQRRVKENKAHKTAGLVERAFKYDHEQCNYPLKDRELDRDGPRGSKYGSNVVQMKAFFYHIEGTYCGLRLPETIMVKYSIVPTNKGVMDMEDQTEDKNANEKCIAVQIGLYFI
jgi:hypothetical protein